MYSGTLQRRTKIQLTKRNLITTVEPTPTAVSPTTRDRTVSYRKLRNFRTRWQVRKLCAFITLRKLFNTKIYLAKYFLTRNFRKLRYTLFRFRRPLPICSTIGKGRRKRPHNIICHVALERALYRIGSFRMWAVHGGLLQ